MCCKGFTKRVLPFFLTFAVGLFIAGFFVSIAAPSFQFPNRGSRKRHLELDRQKDLQIQQLQEKVESLQNQQTTDSEDTGYQNLKYSVPAPPMPPVPPTLKNIPRQER